MGYEQKGLGSSSSSTGLTVCRSGAAVRHLSAPPPTPTAWPSAWQSMCSSQQIFNTKFDSFPHKSVPPPTFPSPTLIAVVPCPCNLKTTLDPSSSCAPMTHCPTPHFLRLSNVYIGPFLFVLTASTALTGRPHTWLLQDWIDFLNCVCVVLFMNLI